MEATPQKAVDDGTASPSETSPLVPSAEGQVPWSVILARVSLLLGVVGLAGLIAWNWNEKQYGAAGATLALLSMSSCGLCSASALVLVGVTAGTPQAFNGVMGSILLRTLGPLGVGAAWQLTHPNWPVDNLIAVHVSLFLVSLTVETILVVDIVSNSSGSETTLGKGRATRKEHG